MRTLILSGAAALALLTLRLSRPPSRRTMSAATRPCSPRTGRRPSGRSSRSSDTAEGAIRDGLVAEHTQQKTPDGFKPEVGPALPKT